MNNFDYNLYECPNSYLDILSIYSINMWVSFDSIYVSGEVRLKNIELKDIVSQDLKSKVFRFISFKRKIVV